MPPGVGPPPSPPPGAAYEPHFPDLAPTGPTTRKNPPALESPPTSVTDNSRTPTKPIHPSTGETDPPTNTNSSARKIEANTDAVAKFADAARPSGGVNPSKARPARSPR